MAHLSLALTLYINHAEVNDRPQAHVSLKDLNMAGWLLAGIDGLGMQAYQLGVAPLGPQVDDTIVQVRYGGRHCPPANGLQFQAEDGLGIVCQNEQ